MYMFLKSLKDIMLSDIMFKDILQSVGFATCERVNALQFFQNVTIDF